MTGLATNGQGKPDPNRGARRRHPGRSFMLLPVAVIMSIFAFGGALLASQADRELSARFGDTWPNTDFSRHTATASEFLSGGPARDGIPSVDNPRFERVSGGKGERWISNLTPAEPVIAVTVNGEAHAYPLEIMLWHEIVNDVIGGVPVAVTYCPLCNAALAFRREVDGKVLDFGTTGLLRKSNLVMYDRQTESWWQQFTGRSIAGEMATAKLSFVPARLQSFKTFSQDHPDGLVLVPEDRSFRPYGKTPYRGYDSKSSSPFLDGQVDTSPLNHMSEVVVLRNDSGPIALSVTYLRAERKVSVGGAQVEWQPGLTSVLDRQNISEGRDIGEIAVYRDGAEQAGEGSYQRTFAFVYRSFFPQGVIIAQCEQGRNYPNVECR